MSLLSLFFSLLPGRPPATCVAEPPFDGCFPSGWIGL